MTEFPEVTAEHQGDHSHRDVNGGWLRPAVFGAMDGLVSNFALIAGMDGGTDSGSKFIILAGLAGLAAGAFSMAAGEYTSVASQRELARARRCFDEDRSECRSSASASCVERACIARVQE